LPTAWSATTATPVRATPTWTCRRASISRPRFSISRTPPAAAAGARRPWLCVPSRSRSRQYRSVPAGGTRAQGDARAARGAGAHASSAQPDHQGNADPAPTSDLLRSLAREQLVQRCSSASPAWTPSSSAHWSRARVAGGAAARSEGTGSAARADRPCWWQPIIPAVNDCEVEDIVAAGRGPGRHQGWLRAAAPAARNSRPLFTGNGWTSILPDRADHVMSLIRAAREGRERTTRASAARMDRQWYPWALAACATLCTGLQASWPVDGPHARSVE